MNARNTILLFSFCFICINRTQAQHTADSIYTINAKSHIHSLRAYSTFLIDSSTRMDVKEIASGKYNDQFIPLGQAQAKMNVAFSYWIKFRVFATATINDWWLLLYDTSQYGYYPGNCYVDVYIVNDDNLITSHLQTGSLVSRSSK